MIADTFLWLLQANDSAYPSGAYAHSFGLEELVECGVVSDAASLERFLMRQVIPALLEFDLPYFAQCHEAALAEDFEKLVALDNDLDAWRLPAEIRDASRRIGGQRLGLLMQLEDSDFVRKYQSLRPQSHHLVVTAIELRGTALGLGARAFTYQTVAGFVSASLKLIRIGQTACQGIQHRCMEKIGPGIDKALCVPPDGWFNPLLEISSLRHARANARLFIS